LATDCRFRAEHAANDAAGFSATLAEAVLESTDGAIADATGVASLDDDVAPGEARFAVEPTGVTGNKGRSRIVEESIAAFLGCRIDRELASELKGGSCRRASSDEDRLHRDLYAIGRIR
jgi:hypothetical protein